MSLYMHRLTDVALLAEKSDKKQALFVQLYTIRHFGKHLKWLKILYSLGLAQALSWRVPCGDCYLLIAAAGDHFSFFVMHMESKT